MADLLQVLWSFSGRVGQRTDPQKHILPGVADRSLSTDPR